MNSSKKRILVIGAGPSGLGALIGFVRAVQNDKTVDDQYDIVCYEKQNQIGGLWNLTWRTGVDEYNEPLHNSMYQNLWSNGPKECTEFNDYSFDEHFGRPIGSYPPRTVLFDYIQGRVRTYGVNRYIRFHSLVKWVTFTEESGFTVRVEDLSSGNAWTENFDFTVVAAGHYSFPNIPECLGIDTFQGRVLHSHDFRDARQFAGQSILVVGGSYSAEDIASQCYKFGSGQIAISYRTAPIAAKFPEGNFHQFPEISKIEKSRISFKNNHHVDGVDAIIFCTGYKHHFPFLAEDLRLITANRLYPPNLFKGVVFANNKQLFYIGMQDQWYTFNMFDVQAYFALECIFQKFKLPDVKEQRADMEAWEALESRSVTGEDAIDFQTDYCIDLTSYLPSYAQNRLDWNMMRSIFKEWKKDKTQDIMKYRNNTFKSALTGTAGILNKNDWVKVFDDSIKTFIDENC